LLAPRTVVGLAFHALEAGLIVVRFIAPPFDGSRRRWTRLLKDR
jgi:hypothetical protein